MNPIKFDRYDVKTAADLYYAGEKYDINDIRKIAREFMIERCNSLNAYFLFGKAKTFSLPDLEKVCREMFARRPYQGLAFTFDESLDDDLLSELIGSHDLCLIKDFDLYMALQVMVETKKLERYSKCLKQIRFLTMETGEILHCDLLSHEERCAVLENIEARKQNTVPMIPMPPNLSKNTELRK